MAEQEPTDSGRRDLDLERGRIKGDDRDVPTAAQHCPASEPSITRVVAVEETEVCCHCNTGGRFDAEDDGYHDEMMAPADEQGVEVSLSFCFAPLPFENPC